MGEYHKSLRQKLGTSSTDDASVDDALTQASEQHGSDEYRAAEAAEIMMRKNFDATGGFGPSLVTADELPPGCTGAPDSAFYIDTLRQILMQPEFQKEMGTAELHYLLGKYCAEWERKNKLKDVSVLAAAYRAAWDASRR